MRIMVFCFLVALVAPPNQLNNMQTMQYGTLELTEVQPVGYRMFCAGHGTQLSSGSKPTNQPTKEPALLKVNYFMVGIIILLRTRTNKLVLKRS